MSYQEDGRSDSHRWQGETGVPPFTAISIFDSPAVALHVDDALNYIYTPGDLALFGVVGKGIEEIQQRLGEAITARSPKGNPFLSHFAERHERLRPCRDARGIHGPCSSRRARPGRQACRSRTGLQTGHGRRPPRRRRRCSDRRFERASRSCEATRGDRQASRGLPGGALRRRGHRAHRRRLLIRHDPIEFCRRERDPGRRGRDLAGLCSGGEAYRRHLLAHDGDEPEVCIYCRQSLDEAAARRLETYRQFADDAARQRLEAARSTLDRLTRNVLGADLAGIRDALGAPGRPILTIRI